MPVEPLERHPSEDDESFTYRRGFEHALRNVIAALERHLEDENDDDVRLGIEHGIAIAKRYQGFLLPKS